MRALTHRLEEIAADWRREGRVPSRAELEDLYTHGCGEVLQLEAARARARRMMREVTLELGRDERAVERVAALQRRELALEERVRTVRAQVEDIRVALGLLGAADDAVDAAAHAWLDRLGV